MTGFDYEEFVESFYLAQRELTTPHPRSHALMAMAGRAPLARIRGEVQEANAQDTAATTNNMPRIAGLGSMFAAKINLSPFYLKVKSTWISS